MPSGDCAFAAGLEIFPKRFLVIAQREVVRKSYYLCHHALSSSSLRSTSPSINFMLLSASSCSSPNLMTLITSCSAPSRSNDAGLPQAQLEAAACLAAGGLFGLVAILARVWIAMCVCSRARALTSRAVRTIGGLPLGFGLAMPFVHRVGACVSPFVSSVVAGVFSFVSSVIAFHFLFIGSRAVLDFPAAARCFRLGQTAGFSADVPGGQRHGYLRNLTGC